MELVSLWIEPMASGSEGTEVRSGCRRSEAGHQRRGGGEQGELRSCQEEDRGARSGMDTPPWFGEVET